MSAYLYSQSRPCNRAERDRKGSCNMKKKTTVLIAIIAVLILAAAAWLFGYHNRKSTDNLPSLAAIAQMEEAEVNRIVCGYRRGQLAEVWGSPDESSPMEDIWTIKDNITLTVNYHNNDDKAVICGLSNQ